MDYDYELRIPGNARPQGRPRTRVIQAKFGKKSFATVYEDRKDKEAKAYIRDCVRRIAPQEPLVCPLKVVIVYGLKRPRADYGTGRNSNILKETAAPFHIKKPDVDNLAKLTIDALTGVFWKDDTQIVDLRAVKDYSSDPMTLIKIKKIPQSEGLFNGVIEEDLS